MDLKEARLAQLLVLLAEEKGKKSALAKTIKKKPAQVSQWLSSYRTISEDTAREIEAAYKKPHGWLDQRRSSVGKVTAAPSADCGAGCALEVALQVVLDALADAPQRDKLRTALLAVLDDDAPAYRQRLAELLQAATPARAQVWPTKDAA